MKEMKLDTATTYIAPEVTVLEVTVEQGFALSSGVDEWGNGGSVDDEIIF